MKLRFVTSFPDRHGTVRYRFRRKGFPSHYFVASPGTAAFRIEYDRCLAGDKPPTRYELPVEDRRRRSRKLKEVVYFIGAEAGPIKIGVSCDPAKRLRTLQTGHPVPLMLLAVVPGGVGVERALHRKFADLRVRGEWFARSPELIAEIDSAGLINV